MLVMEVLRKTADKYGLVCLLHEKPFAGHQRLGQAQQLVDEHRHRREPAQPGRHAARQRPVPRLLHRGDPRGRQVRRSCCVSRSPARNDHRLGANEAPPAIISIFLGDQLTDIIEQIENRRRRRAASRADCSRPASRPAQAAKDAGDRNRTSPFAFTGNKFEFRAVGAQSEHRRAEHGAEHDRRRESLDYIATKLERPCKAGKD
jgi:glutamine synthetase